MSVFTAPRFRRRGIDTLSSIDFLHVARARGLTRLVSLVARWNDPARRVAADRMGSTPVGSVGYWNLGVRRVYFATGGVRLDNQDGVRVEPPDST